MKLDHPPFFVIETATARDTAQIAAWFEHERYDYFGTAHNRARVMLRDDPSLAGRIRITKCEPWLDVREPLDA